MNIVYLNTRFVPLDRAKVSILDRGFLYGDGVFETMRAYNGAVFRLEKHIDRLFKSLKKLRICPEINKSKMQKIIYKLLDKNKLKDAYIKIIVTRGRSSGGLLIPSGKSRPTLVIYTRLYKGLAQGIYKKGIKVFLSKSGYNEKSRISRNKTLNYLDNILCRYEAKDKGFDDAIRVDTEGLIGEATSSNIFLVKEKKLYTPCLKYGILPGITRAEVIQLARGRLKSNVTEKFIQAGALYDADEVFFTNSLVEILPVVRINRHIVGRGIPGPITNRLSTLFRDAVKG